MASLPTAHPIQTQVPLPRVPQRILTYLLVRLTPSAKLDAATSDSDLLFIIEDLRGEWKFTAIILIPILAIAATTFALAPDAVFPIGSGARSSIVCLCYSSGFGLAWACGLLYWLPSNIADFKDQAIDRYKTYATFALQARIPAASLFLSLVFLTVFTALTTSHSGTIAFFFIIFALTWTARHWVYAIHCGLRGLLRKLRTTYEHIGTFVTSFL